MITVRPGSHMYQLLRLLCIAGEFPSKSLGIIGDTRTVKAMVHKMEAEQKIRLSDNTILKTKLFQISGKGNQRTIRLVKKALDVLIDIHSDALGYYLEAYPENKFTGDKLRIWRNHRVGESVAMCMMAGIETEPYLLPELQKQVILRVVPEKPVLYVARNFKKFCVDDLKKISFTRITGLLIYPGGSYAVYNTRDAVMKWSGMGEQKTRQDMSEIVRMNAQLEETNSALCFGEDEATTIRTVMESDKSKKQLNRFDKIYRSVHFVPLNHDGINLLKILTLPDWQERLISSLFGSELRPKGYGSIEFDAYWDGKYIYSHLDGDIARLIRFNSALKQEEHLFEVVCFPWQEEFLKNFLCKAVILSPIEMPVILTELGIIDPEGAEEDEGQ